MISIYDIDGSVIMNAEITKDAVREEELSKSDYISLSFNAAVNIVLPAGAYIEYSYPIDAQRVASHNFILLEPYSPTQTDEITWKYTPQFQHPKMMLSKIPFYLNTKNSKGEDVQQTQWSFVGTPQSIMGNVCDFLNNDIKFANCGWKAVVTDVVSNNVDVSFDDADVLSALTSIANAVGDNCEWHIDYDSETIYLGKIIIGEKLHTFKVGENVGVPSVSTGQSSYYNSYKVFGGTRNITQLNKKGENISSNDIRLQLQEGEGEISIDKVVKKYTIDKYSTLDLRQDKEKEPLFTKVLNFSDVFPSLYTYVYNVRYRKKYVLDSETNKKIEIGHNADGSVKYKTFSVWYMRLAYCTEVKDETKTLVNTTVDDGITHYWYDFEIKDSLLINGKTLSCSFEPNLNKDALSTPLAGRGTNGDYIGFELKYHDKYQEIRASDDVSEAPMRVYAGDYEIIYQEDNDIIIPTNKDEEIVPKGEKLPSLKCNITVLYNIAMDDIYYTIAQQKLLEVAKDEIKEELSDKNNYSFKLYPHIFASNKEPLRIGDNVEYNDGHGYLLDTRILKITTNIDYNFVQEVTVGNQAIKGTITQLKEDVQSIIANGGSSSSSYTVAQIKQIISNYGLTYFLSKKYADVAQDIIRFIKGISIGANNTNYNFGITEEAIATLKALHIGDNNLGISADGIATLKEIVSSVFSSGALGTGFKLGTYGDTDDSYLEVDRMLVRKAAEFVELVIRELRSVGGEIILTPASMKCTRVVAYTKGDIEVTEENGLPIAFYRCYFQQEADGKAVTNEFILNDLVRCQQFNIKEGTTSGAKNRYYWRECVGKGEDFIDLSATDCDTNSDAPMAGDEMVQLGNSSDATRQSAIILSAYGDDAPSMKFYRGINSYTLTGKEVVVLSRKEVSIIADKLRYRTSGGTYAGVDEQITNVVNTANDAKNKTEELEGSMEDISNEVTTVSKKYTSLSANVDGIEANVKAVKTEQDKQGTTISKLDTRVTQTEDAITNEVTERKTYVDGQVETLTSKINQTATEISMQVAQNSNTMSNLLVGSAFRAWDTITDINANYPVKTYAGGVGGSRYARISASGATANTWAGVRFGSYAIMGQKGAKYTYSLWVRVTTVADSECYIRISYKTSLSASATSTILKTTWFEASKISGWTLYKDTIEIPSTACFITAEICVLKNGAIYVCRPMLNEGDYIGWSMSPNDVTEAGNLEKDVKATGIDITNKKITATADKFEVRNNNGDTTASVNAKGVLEVNSGLFTGFVKKKPTVITPDNFDYYKSSHTLQAGYIEMDFEKTGSFLVFQGDFSAKLGSNYIALTLPCTGTSWTTTDYTNSEHPLSYIGQRFVLVNQSTKNIQIAGGGTIRKNGSGTSGVYNNIVENGEVVVIECALTTSYSTSGNTYKAAWNGTIYKQ